MIILVRIILSQISLASSIHPLISREERSVIILLSFPFLQVLLLSRLKYRHRRRARNYRSSNLLRHSLRREGFLFNPLSLASISLSFLSRDIRSGGVRTVPCTTEYTVEMLTVVM